MSRFDLFGLFGLLGIFGRLVDLVVCSVWRLCLFTVSRLVYVDYVDGLFDVPTNIVVVRVPICSACSFCSLFLVSVVSVFRSNLCFVGRVCASFVSLWTSICVFVGGLVAVSLLFLLPFSLSFPLLFLSFPSSFSPLFSLPLLPLLSEFLFFRCVR